MGEGDVPEPVWHRDQLPAIASEARRIRTCTRDPLLRLLYVAVALLLPRNIWVWLHWEASWRTGVGADAVWIWDR